MSFSLKMSLEGEKQLSRRIKGLEKKSLHSEFTEIGKNVVDIFSGDVFNSEGAVLGEPWKGGPRYHKLQVTGKMRNSFKADASDSRLVIENKAKYFKYHQSNKPRKVLPRRVMMKMTEPIKRMVIRTIQKGYVDELQKR